MGAILLFCGSLSSLLICTLILWVGAEIFMGGCLEKEWVPRTGFFFSGFGTGFLKPRFLKPRFLKPRFLKPRFLKPRFLRLEKILGGTQNIYGINFIVYVHNY